MVFEHPLRFVCEAAFQTKEPVELRNLMQYSSDELRTLFTHLRRSTNKKDKPALFIVERVQQKKEELEKALDTSRVADHPKRILYKGYIGLRVHPFEELAGFKNSYLDLLMKFMVDPVNALEHEALNLIVQRMKENIEATNQKKASQGQR